MPRVVLNGKVPREVRVGARTLRLVPHSPVTLSEVEVDTLQAAGIPVTVLRDARPSSPTPRDLAWVETFEPVAPAPARAPAIEPVVETPPAKAPDPLLAAPPPVPVSEPAPKVRKARKGRKTASGEE